MMSTRLLRSSISPALVSRSFATSSARFKAPSIRDITPDNAAAFNARQKEFRENLEAARKKRIEQESQSVDDSVSSSTSSSSSSSSSTTAASTAPSSGDESGSIFRPVVDAAERLDGQALGSLSTHRILGEKRQSELNTTTKRGPLSSLIYGTKEGQQLDKDIERSFSEVLARGKYVHSIVFHKVKPDKVDEYVQLVGEWYPKMASLETNRVNLVGSWRTQVGDNDTFGGCLHLSARMINRIGVLTCACGSSHLGIPALHRIPCVPPQYLEAPGF